MKPITLAIITGLLVVQWAAAFTPTSGYEPMQIEGFRILLNKELKTKEPDLAQQVIRELTNQLYNINRRVPAEALKCLKETTIWVELENSKSAACHHPNRQWLINNDHNPEKTGAVEIGNARHFVNWSIHQPSMVLHELAHYYHWRIHGPDRAKIKKQYQAAKDAGTYKSVLHINGKKVPAYAMNNEMEYFAETTEAFYGTNDMYPFVRSELKHHDPNMFALLKQLWNNPPQNPNKPKTKKAQPPKG